MNTQHTKKFVVVRCKVTEIKGRRVYVEGRLEDMKGKLLATAKYVSFLFRVFLSGFRVLFWEFRIFLLNPLRLYSALSCHPSNSKLFEGFELPELLTCVLLCYIRGLFVQPKYAKLLNVTSIREAIGEPPSPAPLPSSPSHSPTLTTTI